MAMLAFEINKRQPLAEGRSFGATGAYEQIDGIAHFGIDPAHPDNRGIADIALAPRDPTGLVRFAADVTILTPRESERGNRRLLLDVPNRGNRLAMRFLNCAPPAVPGTPIDSGDPDAARLYFGVVWLAARCARCSRPDAGVCTGGAGRGGRAGSRPAHGEFPAQRGEPGPTTFGPGASPIPDCGSRQCARGIAGARGG
jgi:hypothetical protein